MLKKAGCGFGYLALASLFAERNDSADVATIIEMFRALGADEPEDLTLSITRARFTDLHGAATSDIEIAIEE